MNTPRPTVAEWIWERRGVAHTSDLLLHGYTHREMAAAVAAKELQRVRRSWLVHPGADPKRLAAAQCGGRVTCLSAAELDGLWVPEHTGTHISVQGTASRNSRAGAQLHWATGPAPVARNLVQDPIVNVLFHVARCVPPVDALAVWESAIRKGKAGADVLKRVAWRSPPARMLADIADELSDSGLETRFVSGMRRIGVTVRQQVVIDGRPVDGLIGDSLVVQLDGFAFHSSATARRRDIDADARLLLRGYTVLRFDYHQIFFQWDLVCETILTAIAQRLHRNRLR